MNRIKPSDANVVSNTTNSEKLTNGDIISYGLGAGPSTLTSQFKTQFFMPFLSDIAGLNITAIGVWSTFMTVFDAINDPLLGGIADRTNTKRFGKYRPHMMMGSFFLAVVVILMFLTPDLSEGGKMFYYIVLMALFTVFNTQFTVPWQALNSFMSPEPHQRNLLLTSRQFIGFIATSLTGIIFVPIVSRFADEKTGWLAASIIVAVLCVVSGFLCASGARKRDYYMSIPNPEKLSFKNQLNVVFKNKAVICTAVMLGSVSLINAVSGALNVYYARYVVKNMGIIATLSITTLIISFILFPVVPAILKRLGKNRVFVIGLLLMVVNSAMLFIMRERATVPMIITGHVFTVTGFLLSNVCTLSMIPDCTDYTEYHYGTVQAGFINAIITFVRKVFRSFSTLIVGSMLGYAGYSADPNTPQVMNTIIDIKVFLPILLIIICFITLKLYPITHSYGVEMRAMLKEQRQRQ